LECSVKNIWLVKHPLNLYREDVKALARLNKLRVVCLLQKDNVDPEQVADDVPVLTLKSEPVSAVEPVEPVAKEKKAKKEKKPVEPVSAVEPINQVEAGAE